MKIALVGAYNHKRSRAPFDDTKWSIWTVGRLAGSLPRVDRVYEVHGSDVYERWADDMADSGAEIFYAADLPIAEWNERYGNIKNTMSVMLAHALYEGASEVAMYNAPHIGEPTNEQRESVAYWFGVLRGAGIKVHDRSKFIDWSGLYGGIE